MRSTDYNDYTIKNGKFIGSFEAMYQNCPDPWHQDSVLPKNKELALTLLTHYRFSRVLDVGCGTGKFTTQIQKATEAQVAGLDTSPTAISKAIARYPQVKFSVATVPPLPYADRSFDLVIASELLWYILPSLAIFFAEVQRVLVADGYFMILQQFYQPGQQKYGAEVMQNLDEMLRLLPFEVEWTVEVSRFINYETITMCRVLQP